MRIEASNDRRLKVYSWDTLSGGTMHFYENVYQYRAASGVESVGTFYNEGDAQSFVNQVYEVKASRGIVYLVTSTSILSSSLRGTSVAAFAIEGGRLLKDVKIFKTNSGEVGAIGFSYDFFSVANRTERPIDLFDFDSKQLTLSFPVVIEDEKTPQGRVTQRKIRYRFDGNHFVRAIK